AHCDLLRNGKVVNSSQMKRTRRLLFDKIEIRSAQSEARLADVAFDNLKVARASATELRDAVDLFESTTNQRRLHQQNKIALLACETFQQSVCDEARKSGYEECLSIRHELP